MTEPTVRGSLVAGPLVTVRGEAQLEGPPDVATLTLTVHASGDSSERTRSKLAEGSNAVSQLLQRFEAAIERSNTSGLHVAPVFNRRTPTKITGYQGTFTTQQPNRWAVVVTASRQPHVPGSTARCDRRCSPPRGRLCGGIRHDRRKPD
jgi:hypothetical protein